LRCCRKVQVYGVAVHGEGSEQIVAGCQTHQVQIFDVSSGKILMSVGSAGNGKGKFRKASGVAFNKKGELFVSDYFRHTIQVFDRGGAFLRSFGGWKKYDFEDTEGFLPALDWNDYESFDRHYHTFRYGHNLEEDQWGIYDSDEDDVIHRGPRGLCISGDGDVLVADYQNDRVQVFREDGTFVRAVGDRGQGEEEFDGPTDVCVGKDGRIYVVDSHNHRVQVFDRDWGFAMMFGSKGRETGKFLNAAGIAVGEDGDIYVSDLHRNDVQVFSREGAYVGRLDMELMGGDGARPYGVCADGKGRLFVACGKAGYIQMLA